MDLSVFHEEKDFLNEIIGEIREERIKIEERYDELSNTLRNDYKLAENLASQLRSRYKALGLAEKIPYFARIDLEFRSEVQKLRIGKTTLYKNGEIAVVDWRAPVSSIYYDGKIGKVTYTCPKGIEERILLLKRQYEIAEGVLIKYYDSDVFSNDELLFETLKTSSDVRLKNIIASIQQEQNAIIRASLEQPLIVQGVAGSGKTTVALHRIAYLAYTYEKKFDSKDILIIAPNRFFLGYISNVLPDLNVDDVRQLTFEEFCCEIIGNSISISNPSDTLSELLEKRDSKGYDIEIRALKYISSIKFKEKIEEYILDFESRMFKDKDFNICGCTIIKWKDIQETFEQFSEKLSISDRLERVKNYLREYLKHNKDRVLNLLNAANIGMNFEIEKELINSNGVKFLNAYIKQFKLSTVLGYYKEIILSMGIEDRDVLNYLQKNIKEKAKKKIVIYEDIAPLMYLQYRIFGFSKNIAKYVVVDEAQDLGPFQLYIVNKLVNNSCITILGDLAQGIYFYRDTSNWASINSCVFNEKARIELLTKSYRTTVEIMEAANKVIQKIDSRANITLGEAVVRHGEKVKYTKLTSLDDIVQRIIQLKKDSFKNIGIIVKSENTAQELYDFVKTKLSNVTLISTLSQDYVGDIVIIPSYLSKGLEFDAVVIADASADNYQYNELDIKLLYVSMTRAMHSLDIYYRGEMSELLK